MNTNRKLFTIIVLIVIASALMTACNGSTISGIGITTTQKERVSACTTSELQLLINHANGDTTTYEGTVDQWLDEHMSEFPCIKAGK